MLQTEAIIAEIIGGVFIMYSSVRHLKGSEGVAVATIVATLILFVAIPLTIKFAA